MHFIYVDFLCSSGNVFVFNSKYDHSFKHDFLYHVFYSVTEGVNFKRVVQNVTTEKEYYVLESFYQNVIVVS